ncbi:hypothetical protein BJ322DRAFT_543148 [Thelephora terrestris]|uniref:Uncharacterized protein n=1 Tax=Thelephora terrestris TaxID=56493 RepID=A0A9P6HLB0_9AGAM|nr:hypothetical protein BJ322DRAFT_543148 [Thelephora terrestris]
MPSTYFHEMHFPDQENQYFPGTYPELPPFNQYLQVVTYQGALRELGVALPMQNPTLWDIPDTWSQSPTLFSTSTPPPLALLSSATEDYRSHVSVPFSGFSEVRPQSIGPPPDADVATGLNNGGKDDGGEDLHAHLSPSSHKLVPQVVYIPPRQQKKSGDPQNIEFRVRGEKGIRLSDALEKRWGDFEGRDDSPLSGENRAQITLRVLIVGCPPWESKISTVDYTSKRQPITLEKLANDVARSVKRFLERETEKGHDDHSTCHWQNTMLLSNMYLTRLVRVSTGSWQPELFVAQQPT